MNRTAAIILSLFVLTALAGGLIALAQSGGDPPTELYVRTVPAGAEVFIDGKKVGVSDDLFEVRPGTRKIKVELSGYEPAVKQAIVPESRIERVILELRRKSPSVDKREVSPTSGKTVCEAVLERAEDHYAALVKAYKSKDWPSVNHHANEMSDLIRDEIMVGFKLDQIRELLKKRKPGEDNRALTRVLKQAERIHKDLESICKNKAERDRLQTLLQSVEDYGDDLHDSIRDGKIDQAPARYAALAKAWEAVARESFVKPGDGKQRERHFVRLVLGKDRMTFEGEGTTWTGLPHRLQTVPNRGRTVLELAVASNDIVPEVKQEALLKAVALGRKFGFEYVSEIGVHGLGSKGSASENVKGAATDALRKTLIALVEDFFSHNFRDVTARKTVEWGDVQEHADGNRSIRYMYLATIWGKKKLVMNQVFTFDSDGKYVKHENVEGFPKEEKPETENSGAPKNLRANPGAESGDEAPQRTVILPDEDTPGAKVVLDLASGEMLEAPKQGGVGAFTKLGKGDLLFDRILGCLRGAKARRWDGTRFVEMKPKDTRGDASAYEIPSVPCRLLITTAEKRQFDVSVVSIDNKEGAVLVYQESKGFPKDVENGDGPQAAIDQELARREIGKKVKDFAEKPDLSTPESAWAAYTRASGNQDTKGVADSSWAKIDPAKMERFWKKADPKDMAAYNKAQLDSECVEVLTLPENLAAVISRLEFPEGKGRHPYSVRFFGLRSGKWKNLGEDRCPTLEAARENVRRKIKAVFNRFERMGVELTSEDTARKAAENRGVPKPPRPVKITPEVGATGVDPALKEIRVTFDRDMNTKGMSWCGAGEHFPKIDGEAKWIDKRTCVLPVKLEEGKAYRLALNWEKYRNFRSADGVPVAPTAVYFCTKGAGPELLAQMTPPKVVKLSIENGAKDVPPGKTKLSVTFDQPMDEGMSWCRNGVKSVGEPVWSEDKKTCGFTAVLEPGRDYRVRLNPPPYGNFMNEVGVSLKPVIWTFSTAGKKTEGSEAGNSATGKNLLENPGAESGDKTPDAWEQGGNIPGVTYSWAKNVAHGGKASLCIEKTAKRYFPIAAWSQTVERTDDAPKVKLCAQVKAEKMTKAVLDVVFLDKNDKWISHEWAAYIGSKKSGDPPADHDWKEYSGRIKVPDGTVKYRVGLQVYGPGKVWFDDVRLEEVAEEPHTVANPHPVKIVPEIGATDVDPGLKEIRVTFDRDMDTDGMSWCGAGEHFPKVDGGGQWIDQRTCVLPVKLEAGKAYRVALNWERYRNFRSDDGVPVAPTAVYFCTKGAGPELLAQMTPPKVVKLSIENGAKDVAPGKTKLSVTFDQPMDGGMSWCSGKDTPAMEPVDGESWSKDKKTCSVMAVLEPGHDYVVYLNSASHGNFMNEVGVSLEPVVWRFSTGEE